MAGVGLFVWLLGYAIFYWALQAIQGNAQSSFASYIFPFAK